MAGIMAPKGFDLRLARFEKIWYPLDCQTNHGVWIAPYCQEESAFACMDRLSVSGVADVSKHLHLATALWTVHRLLEFTLWGRDL